MPRQFLTLILTTLFALAAGALASPPTQVNVDRVLCRTDAGCPEGTRCLATSPPGTMACFSGLRPPPPAILINGLALGRRSAAADLVWVRTTQFIGAPYSEAVQYEGLENWGQLALDLRPDLTHAAVVVGSLLSNLPARAEAADRILARADSVDYAPADLKRMISFWRAATAYYGLLDTEKAADFYEQAYERGGSDLMRQRAETLRKSERSCQQMSADFKSSLGAAAAQGGVELNAQQARSSLGEIVFNCFSQRIRQAEMAAYLATQRGDLTVEQLLQEGYLKEAPSAPPGQQWVLENRIPKLQPLTAREP